MIYNWQFFANFASLCCDAAKTGRSHHHPSIYPMIEFVSGRLENLTPTAVTVDGGTIGYLVNISLNTFGALEGKQSARLLIHVVIRVDAWTLFGFLSEAERSLFRALIGVSGVGATTAMLILSAYSTAELEALIASGDTNSLKNIKGIGKKTAERIIVDLRDKIKASETALQIKPQASPEVFDEALAAMVMLGYTRPAAQKALKKVFDADPATRLETAIKKALAMM